VNHEGRLDASEFFNSLLVRKSSDAKLAVLQDAIDSAANEIRGAGLALSPEDDRPLDTQSLKA
jgi:hypothetical protein